MLKNIIPWVQIILYLLSPFIAFAVAKTTNAVDYFFIVMFIVITISQWLAINVLGKVIENT